MTVQCAISKAGSGRKRSHCPSAIWVRVPCASYLVIPMSVYILLVVMSLFIRRLPPKMLCSNTDRIRTRGFSGSWHHTTLSQPPPSTLSEDSIRKDKYRYNRPSLAPFSTAISYRSVFRLAVYVRQIVCTPSSRVQIIRSISSRWRFKCPRVTTAPNGLIRHGFVKLLSFSER